VLWITRGRRWTQSLSSPARAIVDLPCEESRVYSRYLCFSRSSSLLLPLPPEANSTMATALLAALPPSLGCPFSSKDAYTTNFKASLSCPISRPAPPPSLKVSSPSESFDYPPPLLSLLPHPLESSPVASTSHVAYTTNRLPAIDEASIELHNALHAFAPSGVDYAAKEYGEAFNWGELRLGTEVKREW
jgi:hypothetical protein